MSNTYCVDNPDSLFLTAWILRLSCSPGECKKKSITSKRGEGHLNTPRSPPSYIPLVDIYPKITPSHAPVVSMYPKDTPSHAPVCALYSVSLLSYVSDDCVCLHWISLLFYIPESIRQRMSRDQEIQQGKRRTDSQEVSYISFFSETN